MSSAEEKLENCGWGSEELLGQEMACLIRSLKIRVLIPMSSLQLQMLFYEMIHFMFSTAQGTVVHSLCFLLDLVASRNSVVLIYAT